MRKVTIKSTMADALQQLSDHHVRGDLVCTQCARVAGTAEGSSDRQATSITIRVDDPSHVVAVKRLGCPRCSGRLWLQNSENVRNNWHALGNDAVRPYSGRHPKTPSGHDQATREAP
jgi:hypothetical protein